MGFTISKIKKEEEPIAQIEPEDTIIEPIEEIKIDSNLLKEIEELQNRLMDIELELGNLKDSYSGEELKKREQELLEKIDEIQGRISTIDKTKDYYVIIESFKYPENAERAVGIWRDRGYEVAIIHNEQRGWYYIVVATCSTYNEAKGKQNSLREKGVQNWIFIKSDY